MDIDGISLKEKSMLALMASKILGTKKTALVFGKTIYLHNATREELLADHRWLSHELAHVAQYKKYGVLKFLLLYSWYSLRHGYYNNPFEVEARSKEIAD
jgi:hypothetical protein